MKDPTLQALSALFLAFPSQERTDNEKQLAQVYLMAVEGLPAGFVAMACKRFIQGQVQRPSLTFRPPAAELAVEARRLSDNALDHERLSNLRLPKPEEPDIADPTPEERQRCAEMWARAKAEIEAAANAGWGSKRDWTPPSREELEASRDRIAAYMARQKASAA